jgi:predicted NAD/FAD-dependent oxidoreductase
VTEDWVGAFIHDSILAWAARNNTKPGRSDDAEHLVLHASADWTVENLELDAEEVAARLLDAFWQASGITPRTPVHAQAHRWRYAIPVDTPSQRSFYDVASGIVACGDWAGGPRVEGAFLSGMAAAGRILGSLSTPRKKQAQAQLELF